MTKKKLIFGALIFVALLAMYLPILLLVVFSFSETNVLRLDNFEFGFGLWRDLFSHERIWRAVFNTILIAVLSAGIAVIIGTMACVSIQRMRRRSRGLLVGLSQTPLINADIVTSFSLVMFFVTIGMFNMGFVKLILAHTLICIPIVILIILPRLKSLDQSLFDAAMDLGAKPSQALFQVVIPQLMPAMMGAFLVGFTLSINDFVIAQFNNDGVDTISTLVFGYARARHGIPPEFRALSALIFVTVVLAVVLVNLRLRKKVRKRENSREKG